jgi:uncharacterized membrane protein
MGALFFCGLIGSGILMLLSPKRPDFFQIATYLVFGILGVKTSRGSVWFGLVMAPIVADHIAAVVLRYQKIERKTTNQEGSPILNIIFLIVILSMVVITLPWFKSALPLPAAKAGLISSETPVNATKFLLEANPPGKIFNSMAFGSYLIWAAYPQYQVFIDTRIELFPENIWKDYLNISNGVGDWEKLLDDYGVNTVMLSPTEQTALNNAISESDRWKPIYQDPEAIIYYRVK